VPSRLLGKEHYGARTIRPRLQELLAQFLVPTKAVNARFPWNKPRTMHSLSAHDDFTAGWALDRSVSTIRNWDGGTKNALRVLADFVNRGMQNYSKDRNHPELSGTSRLSPYLHFGHIGPLTIAHSVQAASAPAAARQAFLEQLIVRRELSVNFVRYNSRYDSFECLEPWCSVQTIGQTLRSTGSTRRISTCAENKAARVATPPPSAETSAEVFWNASTGLGG
jgi:deoxyribodipyrimidine photo-lyase